MKNNEFKIYVPSISKNTQNNNDDEGTLKIRGVASTINKDLVGDIVMPEAIQSMKEQIKNKGLNLYGDHEYGLKNIYGSMELVDNPDDNVLEIEANIRRKFAPEVKEMLDMGVNLGFSIGGTVEKYNTTKSGWEIKEFNLHEISLTGMPANWDTYGTVTEEGVVKSMCFEGACREIIKKQEEYDKMKKEQEEVLIEQAETEANDNSDDFRGVVDEYLSEKEAGIVDTVVSKIQPELEKIVKNIIGQDSEDKKEEDNDDGFKSLSSEEVSGMINKSINETFSKFEEKFFKSLDESREPTPVVDVNNNNIVTKSDDEIKAKNTYSTLEVAEMLAKKQMGKNPLANEIYKRL